LEPSIQFTFGKDFHKGIAAVFTEGQDGKSGWGFINKKAQFITSPIYDDVISDFKDGDYARGKKRNGQQVYINRSGEEKTFLLAMLF